MTVPSATISLCSRKRADALPSLIPALLGITLFLLRREDAAKAIRETLSACATTLIPSLFPFMVCSEVLLRGGLGELLPRRLLTPFCRLLRLTPNALSALLLGWLCGFPVGARCILRAEKEGRVGREECTRVLLVGGIPSPAFLLGAMGEEKLCGRRIGAILYLSALAISLLLVILLAPSKQEAEKSLAASSFSESRPAPPLVRLLTESVASALGGVLLVCSYVLFFSAISGTLLPLLAKLGVPPLGLALAASLLEIAGGMRHALSLAHRRGGILVGAFAAGWSGLSVHLQVIALSEGRGFPIRKYLLLKLLQGSLCFLSVGLLLLLLPL